MLVFFQGWFIYEYDLKKIIFWLSSEFIFIRGSALSLFRGWISVSAVTWIFGVRTTHPKFPSKFPSENSAFLLLPNGWINVSFFNGHSEYTTNIVILYTQFENNIIIIITFSFVFRYILL